MTGAGEGDGQDAIAVRFAIVVPMLDEGETAVALLEACRAASLPLGPFEICVTNDGSTDDTGAALDDFAAAHPDLPVTIVTHMRPAGQSAAVYDAVKAARAPLICTLDGDGQNPPEEIPTLLAPLLAADAPESLALVAGQRAKRQDPLAKRIASRAANSFRGLLLQDRTRDTGCGLKAFRRDAYLALPYFNHMHRYLPALFQRDGWDITHVDVSHRPRAAGRSKYTNLDRALVGIRDIIGVAWLIRRRRILGPHEITISTPNRAERP